MSTNTDVDAIFDLATDASTPSTPADTETTETPSNAADSDAAVSDPSNPGLVYPNVLRTYKASEIADGENPEGTLTIAEFAGHLTVENLTKKGKGLAGIVKDANIYTGVKASRHPLPVVLVFADDADTTDQRNAKVYLPVKEAAEAWENRPARGESANAASSKRSQDELLTGLAKKTVELAKIAERLARTQGQFDKATKTVEKYHGWLTEYYKGATPVELTDEDGNKTMQSQDEANAAALRAAVETRIDELAAEEDAAKNSDIPDADDK